MGWTSEPAPRRGSAAPHKQRVLDDAREQCRQVTMFDTTSATMLQLGLRLNYFQSFAAA
jgi:hypothetical protein